MGIAEVVEYLTVNTSENDTILSFGWVTKHIAYLANRPVIDISSSEGLLFALRNLNYNDTEKNVDSLAIHSIGYLLFPNENYGTVYDQYVNYSYHVPILTLPENSTDVLLAKRFEYWNLYKITST
jgi:hypothetical protein